MLKKPEKENVDEIIHTFFDVMNLIIYFSSSYTWKNSRLHVLFAQFFDSI